MVTINILLSTFNGEKYIESQIDSVMNQEMVDTILTIRDDGSTDRTIEIIENKRKQYPNRIRIYLGKNIGYRKSFLKLLELVDEADYYGFCDQDDLWLPTKCISAVENLEKIKDEIKLYASGVILTNEKLEKIGKTDSWKMPATIESYFTRQRLAGCTYLFSKELKDLAAKCSNIDYPEWEMPDHDFVVGSFAFACGAVYLDPKSYILHRRHNDTVTSGGSGIFKRIKVEYDLTFHRRKVQARMALLLVDQYKKYVKSKEILNFLTIVADCNQKFIRKIKLLGNRKMTTGILVCDLETKLKIIMGTY